MGDRAGSSPVIRSKISRKRREDLNLFKVLLSASEKCLKRALLLFCIAFCADVGNETAESGMTITNSLYFKSELCII